LTIGTLHLAIGSLPNGCEAAQGKRLQGRLRLQRKRMNGTKKKDEDSPPLVTTPSTTTLPQYLASGYVYYFLYSFLVFPFLLTHPFFKVIITAM
jgi:hypothetical protein